MAPPGSSASTMNSGFLLEPCGTSPRLAFRSRVHFIFSAKPDPLCFNVNPIFLISPPSLSSFLCFSTLSLDNSVCLSMAFTLSLPILSKMSLESHQHTLPTSKFSISIHPSKLNVFSESKGFFHDAVQSLESSSLPLSAITLPFLLPPETALAAGGEFGILEGRSLSLVHPLVMGGFFFYTLWAGYLGWQWRRVRTTQNEITELKKQLKPAQVSPEGTAVEASPSPIELKIQQLSEERKELLKGSFRDRHYNAGSILLGFGVLEAIGGGLNTWFRTGKLFPGPHLFAGSAITVLWAMAAALVPAMQKGNETARNLHITLNALNVVLFVWQIPTGIEIVYKVFEFTTWP